MKIELFSIGDAATESAGKLNVLGIFDVIFASQEPIVHNSCAIAIRIRFTKIEEGKHQCKIAIIDQDGTLVSGEMNADIELKIAPGTTSATANIIINLQQLKFQKFGDYSIDFAIDGQQKASLPLQVKHIPTPPKP